MGRQCLGERFDGNPCNSYVYECTGCGVRGCAGDGCDGQAFTEPVCDECGTRLAPTSAVLV
jgi:hypothetical protein